MKDTQAYVPLEIEALPSTTYYIHVTIFEGLRLVDGCTQNLGYAETRWGLGNFYKVLADDYTQVVHEAQRLGYTDEVSDHG